MQRTLRTVRFGDQCVQGLECLGCIRISVHPFDGEAFLDGVFSKVLTRTAMPLHD